MRILLLSILLASAVTTTHAQDLAAGRLSDKGRVLLEGSMGGEWARKPPPYSEAVKWAVHVQPGVTYFVRDRLGIGGAFGAGLTERPYLAYGAPHDAAARDFEFWIGPHALWDVPMTERVSLLVRPGVFYSRRFRHLRNVPTPDQGATVSDPTQIDIDRAEYDARFVRFALSLPLTLHLSSSVALGFGPAGWFDYFVSQHPRATLGPPAVSPNDEYLRGTSYPRTRMVIGLASWIGGSF